MTHKIEGIVAVMLTPFTDQDEIDYPALERLIEWYLEKGADALFAICQSSEMQFLTLAERAAIGHFVVKQVAGRVPVVISGHISNDPSSQIEELTAAAKTGADAVVLVTNRLDPEAAGTATFRKNLNYLMEHLPSDIALGLYECPAPYRRLLTDEELKICIDSGRFVLLKDVSCDLATVKQRVASAEGSPLASSMPTRPSPMMLCAQELVDSPASSQTSIRIFTNGSVPRAWNVRNLPRKSIPSSLSRLSPRFSDTLH